MRPTTLLASALLLVLPGCLNAQELAAPDRSQWHLVERTAPFERPVAVPVETVAIDGLPDGGVAFSSIKGSRIEAAWYAEPTGRYDHAILGDGIEAGALVVRLNDGTEHRITRPPEEVFEDRTPRLVDLNEDGEPEVITIRARAGEGAAVTVYGLRSGAHSSGPLVERATTPFIGTGYRWLNIAGVADFLGTGDQQIAYVETPHIGGTLFLYRMSGGELERVANRHGFSNHAIGAREQQVSAVLDRGEARPALAVPSANRRQLRIMAMEDQATEGQSTEDQATEDQATAAVWIELALLPLPGRAAWIESSGTGAVIGLEKGRLLDLRPPAAPQ
ncbi:MAG: hypothetical protein AAFV96_03860 [Pseudomonadota bacterium]